MSHSLINAIICDQVYRHHEEEIQLKRRGQFVEFTASPSLSEDRFSTLEQEVNHLQDYGHGVCGDPNCRTGHAQPTVSDTDLKGAAFPPQNGPIDTNMTSDSRVLILCPFTRLRPRPIPLYL
ncbi:hypothetical protein DPEC_G00230510 [Dallia pectoralis]|uniref:Uncharacterized protein n=1 Tax=Dallia pectoralis TaxID=75939 RepID=A0ACC2G1X7_DALPE|nr:hypothetical protein DPEC_G00230510 [Dallia pectoralis]